MHFYILYFYYDPKQNHLNLRKKQHQNQKPTIFGQAVVDSRPAGIKNEPVSYAEKWPGVRNDCALTTPQPLGPLAANTSTYLQERRDKKINECTLNYITTYHTSAHLVFSGGVCTQQHLLYLHNALGSLFRSLLWDLIRYFVTKAHTNAQGEVI